MSLKQLKTRFAEAEQSAGGSDDSMSTELVFILVGLIGLPLAIMDGLTYGWIEAGIYAAFPAGMLGAGVYSFIKKMSY